jgi:anthranilate/para-aminobenzoate synthase component I
VEDALAVYGRLRRENPSHHGAFIALNQTTLLSSSPEVFLSVSASGRVATKPIKGTRPRGATPQADRALRDELENNPKERAENVMIVDLMRNDLSRVAEEGSVVVDTLLAVESYANVHQLVSTVSAQLRPEFSAADAVEACFPAGSMTGAPKISAMRILAQLEGDARGIYSGAFGFFGDDGAAELAMVIRSLVIDRTGVTIGSGGGITIDSDAEAELAEMHLKAEPLLRALGQPDTPVT